MFKLLYILLIGVFACSAAFAQQVADTTVALGPAVVEATGSSAPATAPVRLSVIGAEDLELASIRSVADALDNRSSVHVQRYGPSGMASTSIRGTGSKHTAVFLDGLLLSDPQSNQIDMSVIPVVMLESIELSHGPGSAARSSGSLGGAVMLNTLSASERTRGRVGLEAGAYGQRRIGAVAAGSSGRIAGTVAGEWSAYEGDFPYSNPTLIGDPELIREGGDKEAGSLYATARYSLDRHAIAVSGWLNRVDRGLPGPANAPPSDARQVDENGRLWLKSEHRFGLWQIEATGLAQRTYLRYDNPPAVENQVTRTTTYELRGSAGRALGSHTYMALGVQAGNDRTTNVSERRLAGFAEFVLEWDRLIVLPSARVENWSTASSDRTEFVPRIGANWALSDRGHINVKANIGRAYRIPSFLERFWQPGGNPDLEPERGWSADAGIFSSFGQKTTTTLEAGVFYASIDDQIVWFPSLVGSGVQVWKPSNVGQTVSYGTEVSADIRHRVASGELTIGFTGTFSRSVDRSDPDTPSYDKQLRYVPGVVVGAFAGVVLGRVRADVTVRHVGVRYITSDESQEVDPYTVVDAQAGYRVDLRWAHATFTMQVENLFDADYAVVRFYPMPPRSVGAVLQIEI